MILLLYSLFVSKNNIIISISIIIIFIIINEYYSSMKLTIKQLLLIRKYLNGRTKFRFGGTDSDECSICLNDVHKLNNTLGCGHKYCTQCLYKWIQPGDRYTCPYCRAGICDTDIDKMNSNIDRVGNNGRNFIRRLPYCPRSRARTQFDMERNLEIYGMPD